MARSWATVARLARRTGFGATGAEVDALVRAGGDPVATLLTAAASGADDPGVRSTPPPDLPYLERPSAGGGSAARAAYATAQVRQRQQLQTWWIRRMASVTRPFAEKMTFVWHDHFATGIGKVGDARLMLTQNATLREGAFGDFGALARAVLTDPAMLVWLDGTSNIVGAPNENLAREFMELFTLGHDDGYDESDVRAAARALTGWRVDAAKGTSFFDPKRHDDDALTLFGRQGPLDADGFCARVLDRPGSPDFVVGAVWRALVSPVAPDDDTRAVLREAYGPDRSVRDLVAAALGSPAFAAATGSVVVSPVEWVVGLLRALAVPVATDDQLDTAVASLWALGQMPFSPPSVGGWPSGAAWLSTAATGTRFAAARSLATAGDLGAVGDAAPGSRLDAVAHLLGIASWSTRSAQALAPWRSDPVSLVAVAANTPEYLTH